MSMLSQYYNYTDIGEFTKLQLFEEAYRKFNASCYYLQFEPAEIKEDPFIMEYSDRAAVELNQIEYIFKILGIYDEWQKSTEKDVIEALEKYPA